MPGLSPVLLCCGLPLAEAFSERAGIINLGLEGMMLAGAFFGVVVSSMTGNPWLGLLAGAMAGGILGFLHALFSLWGKADQIVSGMGINLLSYGLTGFFLFRFFGMRGNSPEVTKLPAIKGVMDIPFFSDLLFPLSPLHTGLIIVVFITIYVFLLYSIWSSPPCLRRRSKGGAIGGCIG